LKTTYHHTQPGTVIILALGAGILIMTPLTWLAPSPGIIPWIVPGSLGLCGVLFYSMTIRVEDGWLKWHFGPGLIRKKVALPEIESVEPVRNSWVCGWGIHYTGKGGWLYNVSGMEAVQIVMKNGKRFRLGTDEPMALAQAIGKQLEEGRQ
jgi:hypothetical protein